MKRSDRAQHEPRANLLEALAHPVRLKLVDVLAEHTEVCVCDRNQAIGIEMSTVSRHLTQLKNVGIVEGDTRCRWCSIACESTV